MFRFLNLIILGGAYTTHLIFPSDHRLHARAWFPLGSKVRETSRLWVFLEPWEFSSDFNYYHCWTLFDLI